MDSAKLLTVLCSIMLLICLVLTLGTLVVFGNTVKSIAAHQESASLLLKALEDTDSTDDSLSASTSPDTQADVLYNRFVVKETDGKVGIYSEDGYLIRSVNVKVSTLPKEARQALEEGVTFHSWKELIALIEEYES